MPNVPDLKKALLVTALSAAVAAPVAAPCPVLADSKPSIWKTIEWAVDICHDPSYGYSQEGRWGSQGYDCSSFVISAFWEGGFNLGYSSRYEGCTADIKDAFIDGGFEWIPASYLGLDDGDISQLEAGDVLLVEGYHAELYIGDGLTAAAHEATPSDAHPNRSEAYGDQGDEVCVYEYVHHNWSGVLRYTGGKSTIKKSTQSSNGSGRFPAIFEVTPTALYVRAEPSKDSGTVQYLTQGEYVILKGAEDGWGRAYVYGTTGYIKMDYLNRVVPIPSDLDYDEVSNASDLAAYVEDVKANYSPFSEGQTVTVDTETLYVRKKPDNESTRLYALDEYDRVELLETQGMWGRVLVEGISGWINLNFCR